MWHCFLLSHKSLAISGSAMGIAIRGQKNNANLFCIKLLDNPSGHGRPRRKSWMSAPNSAFSCGPGGVVVGRNFLTPGHPGVRVRNVRGKSGPKSLCLCLCCFFSNCKSQQSLRFLATAKAQKLIRGFFCPKTLFHPTLPPRTEGIRQGSFSPRAQNTGTSKHIGN